MNLYELFGRSEHEPKAYQQLWNTSISRVGGPVNLPDDFDWEKELQDIARRTGLYDMLKAARHHPKGVKHFDGLREYVEVGSDSVGRGRCNDVEYDERNGRRSTMHHKSKKCYREYGTGADKRRNKEIHRKVKCSADGHKRTGKYRDDRYKQDEDLSDSTFCTSPSSRSGSSTERRLRSSTHRTHTIEHRAKGVQVSPQCCSVGSQVVASTGQARVQAEFAMSAAYCQTDFGTHSKSAQHKWPRVIECGIQCEVAPNGKFSPRTSSVASSPNTFLSPTEYRSTYSRSAHTTYSRAASPPPLSPKLSPVDSKAVGFAPSAATKLGAQSLIRFSRYAVTPPDSSTSSSSTSSSHSKEKRKGVTSARISKSTINSPEKKPISTVLEDPPIKRKAAVAIVKPDSPGDSKNIVPNKEVHIPPVHANVIEHIRRVQTAPHLKRESGINTQASVALITGAVSPRTISPSGDEINTDEELLDSPGGHSSVDSMARVRKWHTGASSSTGTGAITTHDSEASTPTHAYGVANNNNSINTAATIVVPEPLLPRSENVPATIERLNGDVMDFPGMKEFLPTGTAPVGRTLTYPKRSFEGTDVWYRKGVWSTVPARVPVGFKPDPPFTRMSPLASSGPVASPNSPTLKPATREGYTSHTTDGSDSEGSNGKGAPLM